MQKGFGYGSLGAGRYGMSGGMGIRPPRGAAVPDFTTALVACAMWGLTPSWEMDGVSLGTMNGSLDSGLDFSTQGSSPFYCDIREVIDVFGDTFTVTSLADQTGSARHLNPGEAPRFSITSGDPLNGISILNSGQLEVNTDYLYYGMVNGKAAFTPTGAAGDPYIHGIVWTGGSWSINSLATLQYESGYDVPTPDLVGFWGAINGANPIPNVFTTELLYAEVNFIA